VLRTMLRVRLEPVAASQVAGYLYARAIRSPRIHDSSVTAFVRRDQQLRCLPRRIRESRSSAP
jgi:hypothetical protein